MEKTKRIIYVCNGGMCSGNLSSYLLERANNDIEFFKLQDVVSVKTIGCLGECAKGPNVVIEDDIVSTMEMGKIIKQEFLNKFSSKKNKKKRK